MIQLSRQLLRRQHEEEVEHLMRILVVRMSSYLLLDWYQKIKKLKEKQVLKGSTYNLLSGHTTKWYSQHVNPYITHFLIGIPCFISFLAVLL